jgi:signal transduction histidine kinase
LDFRDVLTRVIRFYQPALEQREHPIQIVARVSANPLPVSVDAELMHRAISNLVLNAMDATPDGGTLTIEAACHGDNVRTIISDTGQGMTAAERERLFTP